MGPRSGGATGGGDAPRFEGDEITRDVRDALGAHIRTLIWCDPEERWVEAHNPLAGLSVLDGGRVQG